MTTTTSAAVPPAAANKPKADSLDDLMARQKEVLAALTGKGPEGAAITAERKTALKKEFAALKVEVADLLKLKQQAVEEKAQQAQAQAHSAEMSPAAAAGRGRGGGGRGGMRAPIQTRIDNRPKALEITELHEDLRWEGLLRSHFQTFGLVKEITFLEDDPASCIVTFSTRREAEGALNHATHLNGKTMSIKWHTPARAAPAAPAPAAPQESTPAAATAEGAGGAAGADPDKTPPVGGQGAYAAEEGGLGADADDVAAAAAAIAAATAAVQAAAGNGEIAGTGAAAAPPAENGEAPGADANGEAA
eukprot:Tamp_12519.p1 GENE.Tamp_12519~~Tamp_12519.p1  ORF type:complete len:305 (+),score=70.57 Tamp_12519:675-1589(+)